MNCLVLTKTMLHLSSRASHTHVVAVFTDVVEAHRALDSCREIFASEEKRKAQHILGARITFELAKAPLNRLPNTYVC